MITKTLTAMRSKRMIPGYLLAVAILVLATAAPGLSAAREVIPYDDAEFFIEVNATAGDAGVQVFLDGEQWKELKMHSPQGRKLLDVKAKRSLNTQGITEFFFESAEPSFDEVTLEEFLGRFPEGEYSFKGKTIDGDRLAGTAEFTHNIPDGPTIVSPEEGDTVEADSVVIEWEPVTSPAGIEIVSYEVIVEAEDSLLLFSVVMPPTATSVTVPEEFFDPEIDEYKFEILAKEVSGNQTITESEFEVED